MKRSVNLKFWWPTWRKKYANIGMKLSITDDCEAPHYVILSITVLFHLFVIANILPSTVFPIIILCESEMSFVIQTR
jgi:hypothetical protein